MDSICSRFEDISFDAGPIHRNERKLIVFLEPDYPIIYKIEDRLEEYEKVSFSFLFFDDVSTCLNICQKCVNNCNYKFMSENSLEKHSNWYGKFVECVYYCQHILLLVKLGIGIYDANRVFKRPEFVSKQRLLLYQICENLSNAETLQLMKSISLIQPEKYLEIFILKMLTINNGLNLFISSLFSLKNPVINSFIEEMKDDICVKNRITVFQPSNSLSEDEIYPIKDPKNVGLCFIINEVNIKDEQKRDGSAEDVSVLQSTMEYFNITVKTFTDVPKKFFDDLNTTIDVSFKDKNYSIFFIVIMSHGTPGSIFSSDKKPIDINYITTKLCCKSLNKIPKVLIIQACQGDFLLLKGLETDGPTASSLRFDQAPKKQLKGRSHISDFLLAMSTVEGFMAFRDTSRGTWFIQELCRCMKHYENECFISIITKTIGRVKSITMPINNNLQCIQQPELRSLLGKKLYLKPFLNN